MKTVFALSMFGVRVVSCGGIQEVVAAGRKSLNKKARDKRHSESTVTAYIVIKLQSYYSFIKLTCSFLPTMHACSPQKLLAAVATYEHKPRKIRQ